MNTQISQSLHLELKKKVIEHTPYIIKCARISRGFDQAQLASDIGVAQSTISKLEKGSLLPDAATWAVICEITGIPLNSNQLGFIDFGMSKERVSLVHPGFKTESYSKKFVNPKYQVNSMFSVRFFKPLLETVKKEKGVDYYCSVLKKLKIDPAYFYRLDLKLNELFLTDFLNEASFSERPKMKLSSFWENNIHGFVFEKMLKKPKMTDPLELFVKKSGNYNIAFKYEVIEKKRKSAEVFVQYLVKDLSPNILDYNMMFLREIAQSLHYNKFEVKPGHCSSRLKMSA